MTRWFLLILLCVHAWREDGCFAIAQEKPTEALTPPAYDKDIQPLLQANCWRCHGEEVRKGELALHTPAGIRKGSESGWILVPGQSAKSRLYELVRNGEMPPKEKKRPQATDTAAFIKQPRLADAQPLPA